MSSLLFDLTYLQNESLMSGAFEYGKKIFDELIKKKTDLTILLLKNASIDTWILDYKPKIIFIDAKKNSLKYFKEIDRISASFDYFYIPFQPIYYKFRTKAKLIFTVFDLIQLEQARVSKLNKEERLYITTFKRHIKYFIRIILRVLGVYYRFYYSNLKFNINKAEKIITISKTSYSDIISKFNCNPNKIEVLLPPFKKVLQSKSSFKYKNFFLFVSSNRYTKNTYRGLKALDYIWSKDASFPPAVVTGNPTSKILKRINNKNKIIKLPYISDGDLNYLYENANALIFPSLCEGFGLPPLEALKCGTNVICSDIPCFREIYSKVTFFDPYDINDIANKILNYTSYSRDELRLEYESLNSKSSNDLNQLVEYLSKL